MPPLQTKSPIVSIGHADNKDAAILEQLQESLFLHVTQKNGQNEEPGSCEPPPRHARGYCAAWQEDRPRPHDDRYQEMENVADAARNFLRDGKLNEAIEALAVAMDVPWGTSSP